MSPLDPSTFANSSNTNQNSLLAFLAQFLMKNKNQPMDNNNATPQLPGMPQQQQPQQNQGPGALQGISQLMGYDPNSFFGYGQQAKAPTGIASLLSNLFGGS